MAGMASDYSGGVVISLASVVVIPFVIGYLYGFRKIDPNSYKGKVYYASEVD